MSRKVPEPTQYLPQLRVIAEHFYHPLQLNEQFLRDQYINKRLSAKKIAHKTGHAKSTVLRALKSCNIDRRSHFELAKQSLQGNSGVSYGKKIIKGKIVDHKAQQLVIKKMIELRCKGATYSQIIRYLNSKVECGR